MVIRRGDIYYADLRPVVGSEQGGVRPVLIIQNDMGNRHSPTVICAAITSRMSKATLLQHRKRFSCITRAASHDRQTAPSRKGMSSGGGYDPPDRRSTARQPGYHPYIDRAGLSNYTCKIEKYMIR